MATLDELQQQLTALQQKVEALTTPPTDYYTHRWSGEEIDNAVDRSRTGGSIDAALSNKVFFTDDLCANLNEFTQRYKFSFVNTSTVNRPPQFPTMDFAVAVNLGPDNGAFAQLVITRDGNIYIRGYAGWAPVDIRWTDWAQIATATPPQE